MSNLSLAALVGVQIVQVTLCIAAAALLSFGCLRRRPALAAAVWLAVLCKCATPPVWASPLGVFSWLQAEKPRTPTELPAWIRTASPKPRPEGVPPTESNVTDDVASAPTIAWSSLWPWMLAGAWAAGFLWTFSRAFRLRRRWLAAVVEDCEPPKSLLRAIAERSRKLGMKTPRIVMVAADAGPAASGWFRPTVYLPTGVDPKELESMLVHELVHLRRRDPWLGALQAFVSSAYWFHPGVRWASDELSRCIEEACDAETVRELGCRPAEYAAALVALLERRVAPASVPMIAGMSPARSVKRRLEAVMKTKSHRCGKSARGPWLAFAAAALIALPGAGLPPGPPKQEVQFVPSTAILPNPVMVPTPVAATAVKYLPLSPIAATAVKDLPLKPVEIKNFSHRGYDLKPAIDVLMKRCGLREDAACNAVANLVIAAAEHIGPRPVFAIAGQRLFAFAAEAQHEWMSRTLTATVEEFGVDQIVIETEIWDAPKAELDFWKFDVDAKLLGNGIEFLTKADYQVFSQRLLANKGTKKLAMPRLTVMDGQVASMMFGQETALNVPRNKDGTPVNVGQMTLEIVPKISSDGNFVKLKTRFIFHPFNNSAVETTFSMRWDVRTALRNKDGTGLLIFNCQKVPRPAGNFNVDPPGEGRLQADADPRMQRAVELLKRRAKHQELVVRVYPMAHHLRKDVQDQTAQLEALAAGFQQVFNQSTGETIRRPEFKPFAPNKTLVVNATVDVHEFFSRMLHDVDRRTEAELNALGIPPEMMGPLPVGN